jgi:hypothetical protein
MVLLTVKERVDFRSEAAFEWGKRIMRVSAYLTNADNRGTATALIRRFPRRRIVFS